MGHWGKGGDIILAHTCSHRRPLGSHLYSAQKNIFKIAEILVRNSKNAGTYKASGFSGPPRHIMFILSTIVSLVESFLAAGWVRRRTAPGPA